RAADARHLRLAAQLAVCADLARHTGHLAREAVQLVDHGVDGLFQLQDLAAYVDGDFLRQVAVGDGGRDLGDVADLGRQVGRHRVDVVGEVFPRTGDTRHGGLAAQLALRADLTRNARHLRGETVQLVHHRVEGVLQFQDFALRAHGDLLGEV